MTLPTIARGASGPASVLRLVHAQRSPAKISAVERTDRLIGVRIFHLDESEAARSTRLSIRDHCDGLDLADRCEQLSQISFGRAPREIPYIDLLHCSFHSRPREPAFLSKRDQARRLLGSASASRELSPTSTVHRRIASKLILDRLTH